MLLHDRKFRLTRGSPSRAEVFSAHWRARLLPSRDFGRSADRQFGKSAGGKFGGLTVGSVGACPRRSLNFKTTVAHKGRRYKNFGNFKPPSPTRFRQVGKLAGQDVGRKFFGSLGSSPSRGSSTPKILQFVATEVDCFHANFCDCSREQSPDQKPLFNTAMAKNKVLKLVWTQNPTEAKGG